MKFSQNTKLFIEENAFENVVCEMAAAILSRGGQVQVISRASSFTFHESCFLSYFVLDLFITFSVMT